MKKQVKVIIGIVVVIAILIVGISLFFPSVFSGLTSGTFGKADKYHKSQMSSKDILLRSEFVSDTAQLKNMIQGLIYFSLFTGDMSSKIDSCLLVFKAQGFGNKPADAQKISAMQDYSSFIKNNNRTLGTTISMLTGFYLNDTTDQSQDVENNLRAFSNYVSNLNEKDSVLTIALKGMDNFMLSNKALQAKKSEMARLKSIRDQLLVKGIQLAGALSNADQVGVIIQYALSIQNELNIVVPQAVGSINAVNAQDKLQVYATNNIQAIASNSAIQASFENELREIVVGSQEVNAVAAADKLSLVGSVIYYDKPSMQFIVRSAADLGIVEIQSSQSLSQAGGLQNEVIFAYCSSQQLNVLLSNYGLQDIIQAQQIGNMPALNVIELGAIGIQEQIGFVGATQGLNSLFSILQSQGLGFVDTVE